MSECKFAVEAFHAYTESIGLSRPAGTLGELKAFKAGAEWQRSQQSAPAGWPTDDMVVRGAEELHDSLRMFGIDINFDTKTKGTEIQQEIVEAVFNAMLAAAPAHPQSDAVPDAAMSICGDTGCAEVDSLIGRLMSSDPDFEDCTAAAALLRRLFLEEIRGPKGHATWKDAAIAERVKRVAMRPSPSVVVLAREGLEVYSGPNMNEHKVCAEIVRLAAISDASPAQPQSQAVIEQGQARIAELEAELAALKAKAAVPDAKRCEYCDGTGDVHRIDGEWLGECNMCDSAPKADVQEPVKKWKCRHSADEKWFTSDHPGYWECVPIEEAPQPVAQDGWIPVSERFPESATDVLAYGINHGSHSYTVAGVFSGVWASQETEEETRFEPTHWMPLPAAPEVKHDPAL